MKTKTQSQIKEYHKHRSETRPSVVSEDLHHAQLIAATRKDITMTAFADKRITEALELLNDLAREKKAELKDAIENKYTDLASIAGSITGDLKHRVSEQFTAGKEKVTEMCCDVDKSVRRNPWMYIGGAAAATLVLGYFMGRSRRS